MFPVKRVDGSTTYHVMDYKISATVIADQAVIAEVADTGGGYITDATTTSLVDFVGSVLGASSRGPDGNAGSLTYSTTQGDTEGLVRVYINPDIIYRARMSGGAAIANLQTVTTTGASAAGTTVTSTDTPEADMDDGTCWNTTVGANVGLSRKITTFTANTSWVVTVPFPRGIVVGDTFCAVPYSPFVTIALQLTTNLVEADATVAFGTGATARTVELVLNGAGDSYVHFIARDHALNELS